MDRVVTAMSTLLIASAFWPDPRVPDFAEVAVEVRGEVPNPGYYLVPSGSRAADALGMAGAESSDRALLQSGDTLWVGQERASFAFSSPMAFGLPVSINTAGEEILRQLPGIGFSRAAAMVAHRTSFGEFGEKDDLMDVFGIGPATLAKISPYISVHP
jgi:competence protein ComEA